MIWSKLDMRLLTLPVVARLYSECEIGASDVVNIEMGRLSAGVDLSSAEERLALLLADELDTVSSVLTERRDVAMSKQDRQVYLWIRLMKVRQEWDRLVEPQFDLEELLDVFDLEDCYAEMRFFSERPRREKTRDQYLKRVDSGLALGLERLNREAR